jgi:hypothetical protein
MWNTDEKMERKSTGRAGQEQRLEDTVLRGKSTGEQRLEDL